MGNIIQKYKLAEDINVFKLQIYDLLPNKSFLPDATLAAPGSYWTDFTNSNTDDIISVIEESLQQRIKKEIWFWDYKDAKTLAIHKDHNEFGNGTVNTCVIPIIGSFELSIWDDEEGTNKLDSLIYHPGELIAFPNSQYFHSGNVLSKTRQSLHVYLNE